MAIKIANYIMMNLDKPLNISQLSKEFSISDFTLKRIFKEVFHQPTHHYILEKRLEKAKALLIETNKPIKEIAGMVGFNRCNGFSAVFHKKFNCPPGSLRD